MKDTLNQNPLFFAACLFTNAATQYAKDEEGKEWTTKRDEAFKFTRANAAQEIALAKSDRSQSQAAILNSADTALPPLPLKLKFIPEDVPELKPILANKTAWTLWLLWKARHIVNQNFNGEVLRIAKRIDEKKPQTDGELVACMDAGFDGRSNFMREDVMAFAREAIPFFTGEAEVTTTLADDTRDEPQPA